MPKRQQLVGSIYYDPKNTNCILKEPKSKGARDNKFLRKIRKDFLLKSTWFSSPNEISNLTSQNFGGKPKIIRYVILLWSLTKFR